MSTSNEKSWGDTIRSIEISKKSLPWKPEDVVPVQKIGLLERRTMEREVDPILMQYRDQQKEEDFQRTMSTRKSTKINKMAGQKFNIITHNGHKAPVAQPAKKFRGTREYNLLSHYPNRFHKEAPVEFDEGYYLACSRPVNCAGGTGNVRGRDFNILSNKYKVNHEERQLQDHEQTQEHMREIYWRTHIYDPIRVEMYDEIKENALREEEARKIQATMITKENKLPPRYQTAEGHTYNILTQEITKPSKFCAIEEKSLQRYRGREELLRTTLERSQEKQEQESQRRLNRISYARFAHSVERGFDFVFPDAKVTVDGIPSRPGSVWDRLRMEGGGTTHGARPRDLSGPVASPSPFTAQLSAQRPLSQSQSQMSRRGGEVTTRDVSTAGAATRCSGRVPSLELSRAEHGSPVSYVEPAHAKPGQLVPIVRTGGLGSMALSP